MPELPEVETVRRGLQKLVVGRTILDVKILTEKSFSVSPADLQKFVIGANITATRRRAKVLIIDLSTDYSLLIHLKMTGQVIVRGHGETWGAGHPTNSYVNELPDNSTRVEFNLSLRHSGLDPESSKTIRKILNQVQDDNIKTKLFFNDQRKFGWIKLVPTAEVENQAFIAKLGPEPLVNNPEKEFLQRIKRRAGSTIKAALLDQSVVAGIGNIYADEALWAAKVHPATRVKNLSDKKLLAILSAAADAMKKSISIGGSSMKNYIQPDGSRGDYLDKFANVFRRDGQPCPRCGTEIIKIKVAGRGTHICPKCQKLRN